MWKFPRKMAGRPARRVFRPGICMGRSKAKDVLSRPAAITLESGGRTEIGPELHAIWRLDVSATEARIETVQGIGEALAVRFGGDPVFRRPGRDVPGFHSR